MGNLRAKITAMFILMVGFGIVVFVPLPNSPATGFFNTFETIFGYEVNQQDLTYLFFDDSDIPDEYRPYFNTLMRKYCRQHGMKYMTASYSELVEGGYVANGGLTDGVLLSFDANVHDTKYISGEISVYYGNLSAKGTTFSTYYSHSEWEVETSNHFWVA